MSHKMRVRKVTITKRGQAPRLVFQAVFHDTGRLAGSFNTLRGAMRRACELAGWGPARTYESEVVSCSR